MVSPKPGCVTAGKCNGTFLRVKNNTMKIMIGWCLLRWGVRRVNPVIYIVNRYFLSISRVSDTMFCAGHRERQVRPCPCPYGC